MEILFAILAALFWALSTVIDKYTVSDRLYEQPKELTILGFATLAPFLIITLVFFPVDNYISFKASDLEFLALSTIVGILYVVDMFLYLTCLKYTSSTYVTIILKSSVILIFILEVLFLQGSFTRNSIIGISLLLSGSVLVSINWSDIKNFSLSSDKKLITLILLMWFIYSFRIFIMDMAVRHSTSLDAFSYSVSISVLICIIMFFAFHKIGSFTSNHNGRPIFWMASSRNIATVGTFLYFTALFDSSVTIITAIVNSQPLFVLLFIVIIQLAKQEGKIYTNYTFISIITNLIAIFFIIIGVYLVQA